MPVRFPYLAPAICMIAAVLPRGCWTAEAPVADSPPAKSTPDSPPAVTGDPEPNPALQDPLVPPIANLPKGWKEQIGNPIILVADDFDGFDFTSDLRASFHAHGEEVCASGCAASRHPTPVLTKESFERLLLDYSKEQVDSGSESLETLLFHGRQVAELLDKEGHYPLDDEHHRFLRDELGRTHARIAFRLVDEHGIIRCEMPPTRVPLDRRHVFDMETERLPSLVSSGTVKRVGLHHLWTRI